MGRGLAKSFNPPSCDIMGVFICLHVVIPLGVI